MPSRYYSTFSQLKVSGSGDVKPKQPGEHGIVQKQSFTGQELPGKASDGFSSMKKGFKEVSGYAAYNGLSKGKGTGDWIQKAIKHPGALTKKAKKAGESPMEFAASHKDAPGKTGKQARLAMTLRGFHK